MNKSKQMIFAFFISTAIMSSRNLLHTNQVLAESILPNIQSNAYNSSNIFTKCGYKGQCTWFAYGRVLEKLSIALPSEFYGNAVDWWYANARDKVYPYGYEPKANSIVVWGGGKYGYGHVGFVEKVEGDTVYLNEGNFSVRGSYDGNVKTLSKEAMKNRGNLFLKGYIYLSQGSSSQGGSNSSDSTQNPSSGQPVIKTGTVNLSNSNSCLNVRNSASTSSSVIGSLAKGANVSIVSESNNWYKIKYNSSYGYVSSKYVNSGSSSQNDSSSNNATNETVIGSGTVNVSNLSSYLNVRNSASTSSSIIGSLSKGANVSIVAELNGWYKIKYNSSYGYVSSKYIGTNSNSSDNTNSSVSNTPNTSGKVGFVNTSSKSSYLNLRSNPGGSIIGSLPYGAKLQILGTSGSWYKVNYNGKIGYVSGSYVKLSSNEANNTSSVKSDQNALTNKIKSVKLNDSSATLNLRNSPWTGRILTQIPNGGKVEVLSTNGRWYKVKYESYVGYIHCDYIDVNPGSNNDNNSNNTKNNTDSSNSNNINTGSQDTKNNGAITMSYLNINQDKLKQFLKQNNSLLASEPYFSSIISTASQYNLNPLILFAIAGSEQSFVPSNTLDASKIANNPFNVHGSWQQYNTNISDSSGIAARTVINLSKGMPQDSNLFSYIGPKYAEDSNWGNKTYSIFKQLSSIAL
ncbi:SH3 domain-containing protein [Clostridium sp. JN-1]|uniref:SH3 domain-containing protein n=1 Tax=Clostridium sp. JN-1 TaxID=2483110 RepID=UPI000F0B0359|nr:SH3 domain-containing protein [Clostridium sp. JN-1]